MGGDIMTDLERQKLEEEFNEKYADDIRRMEEKNFIRQKKMEMKELQREGRKKLGLTTTKLLCYYIFIMFNVVLIYALVAMWHFADLSYLSVIISDIMGQVVLFVIYSIRAYKDTKSEENIKLERDKLKLLGPKLSDDINDLLDKVESIEEDSTEEDVTEEDIEETDD